VLQGLFEGIDYGTQDLHTYYSSGNGFVYMYIANATTAEISQKIVLRAPRVFKSIVCWSSTGKPATNILVSPGNPDYVVETPGGAPPFTVWPTGWSTPATSLTFKVTCAWGANQVGIDEIVYGLPPGSADTLCHFDDLGSGNIAGTTYEGIYWNGPNLWTYYSSGNSVYLYPTTGGGSPVTATCTLPADTVLKSVLLQIGGVGESGTLTLSSANNPSRAFSVAQGEGWTNCLTSWTKPDATVTMVFDAVLNAWNFGLDEFVYGPPPSGAVGSVVVIR